MSDASDGLNEFAVPGRHYSLSFVVVVVVGNMLSLLELVVGRIKAETVVVLES